ncbi:alanine racemase [Microbacterium paraoxydans]|uniref:alanine racemase n=1 Tax=Microbacterium paraoxydans TaxID=199592 RepID=UPI001CFC1683|nr:alanine racemase [Microbacterium paraoxydans]
MKFTASSDVDRSCAPRACVDLSALRRNADTVRKLLPSKRLMAVVKGDAYGHGLVESAMALVDAGVEALGVASLEEALELRDAGVPEAVRILAWLYAPVHNDARIAEAIRARIDLSVGSMEHLAAVHRAATSVGELVRVHLEMDTGLGRGGVQMSVWDDLARAAALHEASGAIRIVGLWTQLSYADAPEDPVNERQLAVFRRGEAVAQSYGLRFEAVHTSTSARALTRPTSELYGDTVRIGLALFGVSPVSGTSSHFWGLSPVLSVTAPIVQVKFLEAGARIGYDESHRLSRDGYIGLVPMGYADGVPKYLSRGADVSVRGRRHAVVAVNMDQFLIDLGRDPVPVGAVATILGSDGAVTIDANDWGAAIGSYGDEIVVRFGAGLPRTY